MDDSTEKRRMGALIISTILFLISGYYTWIEFRYWTSGKTAQATVSRTYQTNEFVRRRRRRHRKVVEYTFTDEAGVTHHSKDVVRLSWQVNVNDTVRIQYLPGDDIRSRLEGNDGQFYVWLFFLCMVIVIYSSIRIWQHAHTAVHGQRKKRKKPKSEYSELEWIDPTESRRR